jgi:hypothetical protein
VTYSIGNCLDTERTRKSTEQDIDSQMTEHMHSSELGQLADVVAQGRYSRGTDPTGVEQGIATLCSLVAHLLYSYARS